MAMGRDTGAETKCPWRGYPFCLIPHACQAWGRKRGHSETNRLEAAMCDLWVLVTVSVGAGSLGAMLGVFFCARSIIRKLKESD